MSYELFSGNETLGQIASNAGWRETAAFLERQDGAAAELAETGEADAGKLSAQLPGLLEEAPADVRSVLETIQGLLPSSGEVSVA